MPRARPDESVSKWVDEKRTVGVDTDLSWCCLRLCHVQGDFDRVITVVAFSKGFVFVAERSWAHVEIDVDAALLSELHGHLRLLGCRCDYFTIVVDDRVRNR